MRRAGFLMLVLIGLTWAASEVPSADTQRPVDPRTQWRRTRNGWEHPTWMTRPEPTTRRPDFHPGWVALLELGLVSVVFVAFSKTDSDKTG